MRHDHAITTIIHARAKLRNDVHDAREKKAGLERLLIDMQSNEPSPGDNNKEASRIRLTIQAFDNTIEALVAIGNSLQDSMLFLSDDAAPIITEIAN